MTLIGLDFGSKRVGIASTDSSGKFALPRLVLPNDQNLLSTVKDLVDKWGGDAVVVGESMNLDGTPNPISKDIKQFVEELKNLGVKVIMQSEVYTSLEAERIQGKNEMTDASAAALILKSYIDSQINKTK